MKKMGRKSGAIGFAVYLDMLERLGLSEKEYDVDAVILYDKDTDIDEFLAGAPHQYFDEDQMHAFVISLEKDFGKCMAEVDAFLPFIDNWATCDQLSPKAFKKEPEKLLPYIRAWIKSDQTYTVRFAIGMLMQHFLDAASDDPAALVAAFQAGEAHIKDYPVLYDNFFRFIDLCVKYGGNKPLETDLAGEVSAFGTGKAAMVIGQGPWVEADVLAMADCAINIKPNEDELVEIALETAKTAKTFGIDPKVAFLSYSTKGSGKGENVDKVKNACDKAKAAAPELAIDGEMQFDAAVAPEVGQLKFPGSPVAGYANTFIFPTIEAGNIGYKIAQRLGGYEALGPILQGLAAPINDLSRGCNADEVYKMAIITAAMV